MNNSKKIKTTRELDDFQIRNIKILTSLLSMNSATDEIIDYLREIELDYYNLKNKYTILEKNNNIDEKTNVLKFRDQYLTEIIKTASRIFYGLSTKVYEISFVKVDIDNFLEVNEKFNKITRDSILAIVAETIKENSRPTDYVIRSGFDEFSIILPSTSLNGAIVYIEKILHSIRKLSIPSGDSFINITVSGGISNYKYTFNANKYIDDDEVEAKFRLLQEEAENALLEAKYLGKNRYCIFDPAHIKEYSIIKDKFDKSTKTACIL